MSRLFVSIGAYDFVERLSKYHQGRLKAQIHGVCPQMMSLVLGLCSFSVPNTPNYPASKNVSSTIFRPALSKSTVHLFPSTAATVPGPNFVWNTRVPAP